MRRAAETRPRDDGRVFDPARRDRASRETIRGAAVRTPLVRLPDTELWLKLECLQPIGSFKIRGATNAIRRRSPRT